MTDQTEKATENEEKTEQTVREALEEANAELEAAESAPEETESEETQEETKAEEAPKEVETPAEAPPAPVEQPDWWGLEHGVWDALPREAQDHLLQHEKERTEAIERDRIAPEVRAALGQIEEHSKLYGITADQALTRLFQAQRLLESNPRYALAELARQYGVDPAQLAAPGEDPGQTQQDDPLLAVQQVVQQQLSQWEQRQLESQTRTALTELEQWSKQTGDDGKPLRPHFEELQHLVKPEMDRLLSVNPHRDRWAVLDEAYQNVARVKAADNVESLAEQRAQEKLKQMQAELERAKSAAVSPASGPSGTTSASAEDPKTVREALEQAWAEQQEASRI